MFLNTFIELLNYYVTKKLRFVWGTENDTDLSKKFTEKIYLSNNGQPDNIYRLIH